MLDSAQILLESAHAHDAYKVAFNCFEGLMLGWSRELGWQGSQLSDAIDYLTTKKRKIRDRGLCLLLKDKRNCFIHTDFDPSETEARRTLEAVDSLLLHYARKAATVANRPVVSVGPADTLGHAAELMVKNDFSQLPVLRGESNLGSVTEGLFLRLMAEGHDRETLGVFRVEEHMAPAFPEVRASAPVGKVIALLQQAPAVVVRSAGKISGIITKADLLRGVQRDG
jgi:predicted transcriptional regulator